MWSRLPSRFVARMLTGHAAVGLAASALLYILCVSGTLMVFHQEFARWEQPSIPEFETAAPAAVERATKNALAKVDEPPHHLFLGLPVDGMPRMTVTADTESWFVNADGTLVAPVAHEWTHFLEKIHYYLTLPDTWGLTLVGILGVLMTGLVFSGLLSHPKLFRDAFRLRLGNGRRLRETDLHNRLSVWASPFHLVIAFTGAAIGLATVVAASVSKVHGDGDVEAAFAPIFGAEAPADPRPAPLPDVTTGLENFGEQYPDLTPWYVNFQDPTTAGQKAEILAKHPRRLIYGDEYFFDEGGEITSTLGLSDGAMGKQVVASLYPLHFGSFGGLAVKLAYGVLGIIACVVVASGINIWLIKRRQRGRAAPALEQAWQAILWGTPASLALVLFADTVGLTGTGLHIPLFWGALVAMTAAGMIFQSFPIRRYLQFLAAGLILASVAVHALSVGFTGVPAAAYGVSMVLVLASAWLIRRGLIGRATYQ